MNLCFTLEVKMTPFEKIIYALQGSMPVPKPYGAWHIASLIIVVAISVFLVVRFRDAKDKTMRRIIFIAWITILLTEIYKQTVFSLHVENMSASWSYQWYAFPFQFCSAPLYVLPFVAFMKENKLREAMMTFLMTFSLFAGIAVMLYPVDVFIDMIGINIQTMLHHGTQVIIGVFLVAYNRHRLKKGQLLSGIGVFGAFVAAALIMNIAVHHAHRATGVNAVFNMFFISPYHACTLPLLSTINQKVPYPVFLLIYILGFALIAAIFFAAELFISKKLKERKAHKANT